MCDLRNKWRRSIHEMNINYFDTVKIHKLQRIPISQQTLIFQGKILPDDFNFLVSDIDHNSRIQLVVASAKNHLPPPAHFDVDVEFKLVSAMIEELRYSVMTTEKHVPPLPIIGAAAKMAENELPPPPTLATANYPVKMAENELLLPAPNHPVKMAKNELPPPETPSSPMHFDVDVEFKLVNDMIEELRYPLMLTEKEFPPLPVIYDAVHHTAKIAETVLPPPTQFKFVSMEELHSVKTVTGNEGDPPAATPAASNHTNGDLIEKRADESNVKPPPDANSSTNGRVRSEGRGSEAPLMVVVDYRGERTRVEVNRNDRPAALRNKLKGMGVRVPEDPYFFIHGQAAMEEDKTFRWHHVQQQDEIAVFAGFVTRGLVPLDHFFS